MARLRAIGVKCEDATPLVNPKRGRSPIQIQIFTEIGPLSVVLLRPRHGHRQGHPIWNANGVAANAHRETVNLNPTPAVEMERSRRRQSPRIWKRIGAIEQIVILGAHKAVDLTHNRNSTTKET